MATTFVYKDAYLSVAASNISTYVQSCTLTGGPVDGGLPFPAEGPHNPES